MQDWEKKAQMYCDRIDRMISIINEDNFEGKPGMIETLDECKSKLEELYLNYELEIENLLNVDGGGANNFKALRLQGHLNEIKYYIETAQNYIEGLSDLPQKEGNYEVEKKSFEGLSDIETVSDFIGEDLEEMEPKFEQVKGTLLDDLPEYFDDKVEIDPIKIVPLDLKEKQEEQETDYEVEDVQDRGEREELNLEPEVEEYGVRAGEKTGELQRAQVITIDMGKLVEQDYLKLAGRIVGEREGMKDPAKVVENGSGDSRNVMLIINKKLMPKEPALESKKQNGLKDYERERGDEE